MALAFPSFGITKIILSIAFLIAFVQILSIFYFASREDINFNARNRRMFPNGAHEIDFVYTQDRTHEELGSKTNVNTQDFQQVGVTF